MGLPVERDVLVAQLMQGGPAGVADVRGAQGEVIIGNRRVLAGVDIITHLDDREIADWNELIEYLELNKRAGETVAVTLLRDGQPLELLIVLGTEP